MSRSLPFALALMLVGASLKAQTAAPMKNASTPAAVAHESAACADLHQLMHGAGHPQLDSAQMAEVHAQIHSALAAGASIDSVHQMLMSHLSTGQSTQMKLTASQASAIKSCVVSIQQEVSTRQSAKQR